VIDIFDSPDPDAHDEYERLLAAGEIDENGYKPVEKCSDAEIYEEAFAYMLHDDYHKLEYYWEGDGWNEPYSDSWTCDCDEAFDHFDISWVQIDPRCSNRPTMLEVAREWVKHVRENRE